MSVARTQSNPKAVEAEPALPADQATQPPTGPAPAPLPLANKDKVQKAAKTLAMAMAGALGMEDHAHIEEGLMSLASHLANPKLPGPTPEATVPVESAGSSLGALTQALGDLLPEIPEELHGDE